VDRASDRPAASSTAAAEGRAPARAAAEPLRAAPVEPRQRWRLNVSRDVVPGDQVGRAALEAWQAVLEASGLPIARAEGSNGRARLAFGAPLPATARGERELVDIWLVERLPVWRVREALAPALPAGYRWLHAEDVWMGAPALAGQVAAADWTLSVAAVEGSSAIHHQELAAAAATLQGARSIPRTRGKPGAEKPYDLRPLLISLEVSGPAELEHLAPEHRRKSTTLRMRTRLDPERGTGRPEEVVAALADAAGTGLDIVDLVRTRLLLASEPVD
jgi:radical SAM-linked protein